MRKLVIIPAFNEASAIKATVDAIRSKAPTYDIIVINDHSRDNTKEVLEECGIPAINLPVNLGIGGAVQTGYKYGVRNGYDIAVQVDGDGQHDPMYLEALEKVLIENDCDLVIGSRFIDKEGFQSSSLRRSGIRYFTGLIKLLGRQVITDPTSGMRMVSRKTMELWAKDYPRDFPEPESCLMAIKSKLKVMEVPVIMKARQGGKSSIHMLKGAYYMIKVTFALILEGVRSHDDA
ncbi:MAG: glycosyltransferase family 2 protein [Saccharofermentans sp.]|nr:glycosyltransferase family 2 protein [Saccharofermentans sp.]